MAYKHGVYNTGQATSLTVPVQGSVGLQVIFGTAPIHLAKDPAAAVNTPKLVYSYKEAVEAVGYSDDFDTFTLCQSISACFQVFNVAPIILVNVLDPSKASHVTQNQAESCDVVDGVVLYDGPKAEQAIAQALEKDPYAPVYLICEHSETVRLERKWLAYPLHKAEEAMKRAEQYLCTGEDAESAALARRCGCKITRACASE